MSQTPILVAFRGSDPIAPAEDLCAKEAGKLERFHQGIIRSRVTITRESPKHHSGHVWSVHLQVEIPGDDVQVQVSPSAGKDADELAGQIRLAFDRAHRQLEQRLARRKDHT